MSATVAAPAAPRSLTTPRMSGIRIVLVWTGLTLLAFPLGGLLGWAIGGHVDSVTPALIGGALTGASIGLAQWILLRRDLAVSPAWIVATAIALAAGLAIGAAVVGYETDTGSLVIQGAISGGAVGIAQGLVLRGRYSLWSAWIVAMPAMWALGWFVTAAGGIAVENQFTVFGAYGAAAFGVVSGLLLMAGKRTQDHAA
ncbi:MAG: hypothetical protein ACRDKT_13380 [Actinomycetota bacterium]